MRRTYSLFQTSLYPDSVFFLGDLFDGGREWSTRTTQSPEEQYRKYGQNFWLNEYDRFGSIFFGHWGDAGMEPRPGQPGRKIISSLPGNHDLGFGRGIQASVRKRFNAYFGDGNRIDVIGNHTFVSIDSVSISALGQENPESAEELWRPTIDFLDGAKKKKQRLVQEELRIQRGLPRNLAFSHDIVESSDLATAELPKFKFEDTDTKDTDFPTILLSHVPLYRAEDTPCGPLREHWPPTPPPKGQTEPLEKDERNAIAVRGGYQYQNVLHREVTKDIAEKVGDIQFAFSGDDHDYCEVVHRGYASGGGGIREITVKSISWAMGVRHPGVVLVSLWNPIDEQGKSLEKEGNKPTLQTHLCLLPDQLGIFIRYATLFAVTLLLLGLRAALIASGRLKTASLQTADEPLLPTASHTHTHTSSAETEKAALTSEPQTHPAYNDSTSSNSSSASNHSANLQVRNASTRTRSVSPNNSYALPTNTNHYQNQQNQKYAFPLIQHAGYYGPPDQPKHEVKAWGNGSVSTKKPKKKKQGVALFWSEFMSSLVLVGTLVFSWYAWLLWNG